ncbi:mannosyl-oligosaccharide alpha-1,2-mannosidase [Naganishia albida]|nr:mannosyl-oligosaccharide alpha-1,2-mannosidase [Naganishia albida]
MGKSSAASKSNGKKKTVEGMQKVHVQAKRFTLDSSKTRADVDKQQEVKVPNRTTWPEWATTGKAEWPSLDSTDDIHIEADEPKRDAVKNAFAHSWKAYEQYGWGSDEYHPLSKGGSNLTEAGGIGYTIIDSLDSLLLMGFTEEYQRARDWVANELSFEANANFNSFETTIRILGGLLAAHYLTSEHPLHSEDAEMFLEKAVELGDRLLPIFDSPSGIPYSLVNLAERIGLPDKDNGNMASLAEAGTLQLEFKYLSHLTGDYTYWDKVEKVTAIIAAQTPAEGINPIFIRPDTGQFMMSEIRLGSRGDSYYEYLLKQYLQTDRQEHVYRDMYDQSMNGIKHLMVARTPREGIVHTLELAPRRGPDGSPNWYPLMKQDHLVCFIGGSFLLGITEGGRKHINWKNLDDRDRLDYLAGTGIIDSCLESYNTATGLGPEIVMFRQGQDSFEYEKDWYIKSAPGSPLIDGRNILRPETVESLFLAYRTTGDEKYREQGWKIFRAFEKHCRLPDGGYASIENVEIVPAVQVDKMETFWLSETLKYLYLLFDDGSNIPLDSHVFNTEAHILPVFTPGKIASFPVYIP